MLDAFLYRLVERRINGTITAKIIYAYAGGKTIEQAKDLLHSAQFRQLRKSIQLHKAWGISVIELSNLGGALHVYDVPRKHIRPIEGIIVHDQHDSQGIEYRKPPYTNTVIEVGDYRNLGYLLQAAAYVIYKRGGVADWANFAQIFGMPFREARYDGFNDQVRIQLEQALSKAGSAAYAVLPKEAELTFHESKSTAGSTELYDRLRKAMNEEMGVLILGSTETTTSSASSGYAQSETHADTVSEVYKADRAEEITTLNEQVLPVLIHLGLLPAGGAFAYDDPLNLDEAEMRIKIAAEMKRAGVPISDDWFYETTGIPKPDNYNELKQQQEEARQAAAQAMQQPDEKEKPEKGKKDGKKLTESVEDKAAEYLTRLEKFTEKMNSFFGEALP